MLKEYAYYAKMHIMWNPMIQLAIVIPSDIYILHEMDPFRNFQPALKFVMVLSPGHFIVLVYLWKESPALHVPIVKHCNVPHEQPAYEHMIASTKIMWPYEVTHYKYFMIHHEVYDQLA